MQHKALLTLAVMFFLINSTNASDPAVRAVYGDGVHSFYAGNFQQSYNYLSEVINIGTDDPRVYYFRGLSALQLGSRQTADEDFKKGATFEAERGNVRTVSRALERIQGPDRLLLEQFRSKARLALAEQQEPQRGGSRQSYLSGGRRYSGIGGDEPKVQSPTPELPATMSETTSATQAAAKDPLAPSVQKEASRPDSVTPDTAAPTDTKETKSVLDDPFGDDPFANKPSRTDAPKDHPVPDSDTKTMSAGDTDDPFAFRKPAGSNTQRDQIEMQNEMLDAEAADSRDQREAMNERDAAAGD